MHWEESPSTWCCMFHILMHWGEDPSTLDCCISVHSSVVQTKEPATLVKIFSPLDCMTNRMAHKCRPPCACFSTSSDHRMFKHSLHACPMQIPYSAFCTVMILQVLQVHSTCIIWKILGCCGNTKRHCRNAPYCRNVAATLQLGLRCCSIAAIPCCCNIAAMGPLLQYAVCIAAIRNASVHCRSIAAMTCCCNIAAMPSGIADYLKSATYPLPCTVPEAEL